MEDGHRRLCKRKSRLGFFLFINFRIPMRVPRLGPVLKNVNIRDLSNSELKRLHIDNLSNIFFSHYLIKTIF